MARPLRIEFPGALYHVTARGNARQAIYHDDEDRLINGVYTQYFNRKHSSTGHVFQGRFKAVLVDKEAYLLEL